MDSIDIAHVIGHNARVVALDELPDSLPRLPAYFVVNTQKKTQAGEHWFAVRVDEKKRGEVFDSLGRQVLVTDWMNNHCISWSRNVQRLQSKHSSMCGVYAIYYVLFRKRFASLQDFIDCNFCASTPEANDNVLALMSCL